MKGLQITNENAPEIGERDAGLPNTCENCVDPNNEACSIEARNMHVLSHLNFERKV